MISRYDAILNGVPLSSLNANILITDIETVQPAIRYDSFTLAKRHGSRIYRRYAETAAVNIKFAIRQYDIQTRQEVCNEIIKWARNGGILQTNDRMGQRLRCVCSAFPYVSSALKWTDELTITFTAYLLPFWENTMETIVELTSTGGYSQQTVLIPGNIEAALVSAEVKTAASYPTPEEGQDPIQVTRLDFEAGSSKITLTGLEIGANQTIKIAYDDNLIQSIKVGSTSLLDKRSTGSDDDLVANCAENVRFRFRSNVEATVTYRLRGLWL